MTPATSPIRIAHITPTLSHKGGGVAEYLWSFIRAWRNAAGLEAFVAGLHDAYVEADTAAARAAG